jgi:hypothetical protein
MMRTMETVEMEVVRGRAGLSDIDGMSLMTYTILDV